MSNKYFGTDGIRGIVNKEITPELFYKVGKALAKHLENCSQEKVNTRKKQIKILLGYDNRKSSEMLSYAFLCGANEFGAEVMCVKVCPTPAISFLTQILNFDAGVMITASHNPPSYNGIKIFNSFGEKIDRVSEMLIENLMDNTQYFKSNNFASTIFNETILDKYIDYIKVNSIKNSKLKILFDLSNGATCVTAKKIFDNIVDANYICDSLDGNIINYQCGATNLNKLKSYLNKGDYDIGFAFDGDGDRVIGVMPSGEELDGDQILYNLALNFKNNNKLAKNSIVSTVMSNYALEIALKKQNIELHRVKVGDKYVSEKMGENGCNLGGEQCGHIIIGEKSKSGDGVLTALAIIEAMSSDGLKLVKLFPKITKNIQIGELESKKIIESEMLNKIIDAAQSDLCESGRILVRASGTENCIRVLVEGEDAELIYKISDKIERVILEIIDELT